ncbi:hypothetical protein ABGB19_22495 [Mycobacterium sp. B14F4]|uniref:hypothetical protein n=1 Tax=Mycobacterium sp. B14F4 TaxID=3153565 RepID=UPI00325DC75A
MAEGVALGAGDVVETAMLSLCAGGLVRTWTDGGSRLWRVREAALLHSLQGTGAIGRTLREEGRFREVGMLCEERGTLLLQSRFPVQVDGDEVAIEANLLNLEPAGAPDSSVFDDVESLLRQAVRHTLAQNEFLLVEMGGWDAPTEPFCLFIVVVEDDSAVSVIETAPEPRGSRLWEPHIVAGRETNSLSAPAAPENIDAAPIVMMDAIATWGLEPWDLALTFGQRPTD